MKLHMKIKITKGYLKNYLIPHYINDLRPVYDRIVRNCGPTQSGTTFSNYIYGYHIEYNNKKVTDIWQYLPQQIFISSMKYTVPDEHQRRQFYSKFPPFASIANQTINLTNLSQCKNFEDLYDYVYNIFIAAGHNAPLAIYDTAYRIGFNMMPQILPDRFVYLCAGALNGAGCLYGKEWIDSHADRNLRARKGSYIRIPIKDFTSLFHGLDSAGIENLLCDFFNL